jgi:hypothetical protein
MAAASLKKSAYFVVDSTARLVQFAEAGPLGWLLRSDGNPFTPDGNTGNFGAGSK